MNKRPWSAQFAKAWRLYIYQYVTTKDIISNGFVYITAIGFKFTNVTEPCAFKNKYDATRQGKGSIRIGWIHKATL